jgi:polysaccharide chain length determinant protein (PEP-CTERM system associated)
MESRNWTSRAAAEVGDARGGLSLRTVLGVLRRRRRTFLIPALLVAGLATAAAVMLPARYRAETLLAVEPAPTQGTLEAVPPELEIERQMARITEILHRRPLLEQVAQEFALAPGGRLAETELAELRERVRVRGEGPRSFSLGFEDSDPERATRISARLAGLLLESSHSEREQHTRESVGFIEEQIAQLKERIAGQERSIEAYKERWFSELPEQVESNLALLKGVQDHLRDTSATIAELEARRSALRQELGELEQRGFGKDPAQAKRAELDLKLAGLKRRYTDAHPEVRRTQAELEELDSAIAQGMADAVPAGELSPTRLRYLQLQTESREVEERLAGAIQKRGALAGETSSYRAQLGAAPGHELALAAMTREYQSNKEQYDALLEELHEARLAQRLEEASRGVFRVIEAPRVPTSPVAPHRLRIVLMGILAGLGLGIGAAFLAEQSDTSFRDVEDFELPMNLPVLVAIPAMPRLRRPGTVTPARVAMRDEPLGSVAEQYRILAAKLIGSDATPKPGSLLVTSPAAGEGKTTAAVNLGLALAWMQQREGVLLVDADLGRASVHKLLELPLRPGLADLLTDPEGELAKYVINHRGLYVLRAGAFSHEARAALASPTGRKVLERLRSTFSYLIIDAPPILAVAEGLFLQQVADSVLLVVRARATPRDMVRRAVDSLDPARLAGVVLTDVDVGAESYGYAYPYVREPKTATAGGPSW